MNKSLIFSIAIIIVVLGGIVVYALNSRAPAEDTESPTSITPTPAPVATGGCFVGGCSGQICSDQEGVITTCEYREEYACYKSARCERQTSGRCGWTETPELAICLNVSTGTGSDIK